MRANVGLKPFHLLRKQHALGKSARVQFRNPAREWEMAGLLLAIPKYVSYCSCRNAGVSSSLCSFIFGGVLLFCFVVFCGFLGFLFVWLVCFGIFLTLFPQTSLCWSSHFLQKWPNGSLQLCPFLELFSAGVPCSSEQTSRILVHPPSISMWTGQNFPEPSANTFSSNFWVLLLVPIFSPCVTCGSYYPLAKTADANPWQSSAVCRSVTNLLTALPWILSPSVDCKGGRRLPEVRCFTIPVFTRKPQARYLFSSV